MNLTPECAFCVTEFHWRLVRDKMDDPRKMEFLREVLRVVAESPEKYAAPVPTAKLQKLYRQLYALDDPYREEKKRFNDFMLEKLPRLREAALQSEDPLATAVWMAMAGNYIDFGILEEVDENRLMDMLTTPDREAVDPRELHHMRRDLSRGKRVLYALDNCGECVLDRLLMEILRMEFPQIELTALARGENVLNDATAREALAAGLGEFARVIGNGSNIGGTEMDFLSEEARRAVQEADVIFAKGQGNFETLSHCGLNVYYLFLAKCPFYERWFGLKHMRGAFLNERRFFGGESAFPLKLI